jgi:hypothetical protein
VRIGIDATERRGLGRIAKWLRATGLGPQWDLGQWDELLRTTADLAAWARAQGEHSLLVWALLRQAQVLLHRGDRAGAVALAAETTPLARENGEAELLIPALTLAALVEQAEGRPEAAVALVGEVSRTAVGKVAWYCANDLPDLVRVAVAEGAAELAGGLADRVRSPATRHRHGVATARAVLTEATGDQAGAAGLYDAAGAAWSAFGHVLEEAMALLGAGRCLARLDRPGPAAKRLRAARALLTRLGARPLLAEADAWLAKVAPA